MRESSKKVNQRVELEKAQKGYLGAQEFNRQQSAAKGEPKVLLLEGGFATFAARHPEWCTTLYD